MGYAGTSVEAVAPEAGVATSTVYAAFKTKAALLAAVRESWLEESGGRPLLLQALAEPNAGARLGGSPARSAPSGSTARTCGRSSGAATGGRGRRARREDENRQALAEVVAGLASSLAYGIGVRTPPPCWRR